MFAPAPAVMSKFVALLPLRKPPSLPLKMAVAVEESLAPPVAEVAPVSPTLVAVAAAMPSTVATIEAKSPTVAVELTEPATLITDAVAFAVPLVEVALEVALANASIGFVKSAPAVDDVLFKAIA